MERRLRRAAVGRARRRGDVPAGGGVARVAAAAGPRRAGDPRRDPPRRRQPRVGRRHPAGVRLGVAAPLLVGDAVSVRPADDPVHQLHRRAGAARLRVRLRRRADGRPRRAPGLLPAHQRPHGVDGARRRRIRGHVRRSADARARQPAPAHGPRRRGGVDADGAGAGPRAADAPARARRQRRRAGHRDGPGARQGDRGHPRSAPRRHADRRDVRRSDGIREDRRFADGDAPWIVAVRMVSEGVDIPRLRVGVYATNTVTELFFRQAVGRLVRWNARPRAPGAPTCSSRTTCGCESSAARSPSSAGTACARRRDDDDGAPAREGGEPPPKKTETERDLAEQLSLFAPISATPLDEHGRPLEATGRASTTRTRRPTTTRTARFPTSLGGGAGSPTARAFRWSLVPLAGQVPPPVADPVPVAAPKNSMLARRRQLREQNAAAVIDARAPDRPLARRGQRRAQSQGRHQAHQHRDAAPARTTARAGAHDAEGLLGEAPRVEAALRAQPLSRRAGEGAARRQSSSRGGAGHPVIGSVRARRRRPRTPTPAARRTPAASARRPGRTRSAPRFR